MQNLLSGTFSHVTAGHAGAFVVDTNGNTKYLTSELAWQDLNEQFISISSGKQRMKISSSRVQLT